MQPKYNLDTPLGKCSLSEVYDRYTDMVREEYERHGRFQQPQQNSSGSNAEALAVSSKKNTNAAKKRKKKSKAASQERVARTFRTLEERFSANEKNKYSLTNPNPIAPFITPEELYTYRIVHGETFKQLATRFDTKEHVIKVKLYTMPRKYWPEIEQASFNQKKRCGEMGANKLKEIAAAAAAAAAESENARPI